MGRAGRPYECIGLGFSHERLRERVDARVGLEPHGLRLGGEVLLQQQPLLDRGIRRGRGRVRVRVC